MSVAIFILTPMESRDQTEELPVEIRRSQRRRRTVSAGMVGGTLIVHLPAWMSPEDEALWVEKMRTRVQAKLRSGRLNAEGRLEERAEQLNRRYFGGQLRWEYIRFVTNQQSQYGSCSSDGRIHLSDRLLDMPEWVMNYVIVHELAHLAVRYHNDDFWALVNRYPLTERARGFLIAKDLEKSFA